MKLLLLPLVVLAIGANTAPATGTEKPLLRASSEMPTPDSVRPTPSLVQTVLRSLDKDDVQLLDDCLKSNGLTHGDYASLLRAVRIPSRGGRTLWFVRPAMEPYCGALYGAHLFRYFLVEQQRGRSKPRYRIIFENGGDAFAVYRRISHGLNDIEPGGCIASGCRSARMSFDGHQYKPVRCFLTTWDGKGREVTRIRKCDSDHGSDIQASGFVRD